MKMKQTLNTKEGEKINKTWRSKPPKKTPKNVKRYKRSRKNKPQGHKRQLISKMTKIIFLTKQIWPLSKERVRKN